MKDVLAYLLPLLLWGALSGVLNLALTRKSQIEAWVSAHPRLAAWAKLLRSIGFDPWAAHAWLTLLVKKKLPEAQQANSPVAKLEQRKADEKRFGPTSIIPPAMMLMLCLMLVSCGPAVTTKRCDFQNPEYSARVVECRQRIEAECLLALDGTPEKSCPALVDCESWREKECAP